MMSAAMPMRGRANVLRPVARAFLMRVGLLLALLCGIGGVQAAYAQLTVTPVTWNVIGLDSNNQSVGPDTFPVGARACNTGPATLTNVVGNFIWDSANPFLNLGGSVSVTTASLAAGACADFYFPVTVTRTSLAYDTARRYHITVSANGVAPVSTPTPRELYVERLISQNRNTVASVTGPTTVYQGQTYSYTVRASTATQGYDQLEAFLNLSNIIFQVLSVSTTYTSPTGGTNNKIYADACGWDNNPLNLSTYRSCVGPEQYPSGRAGGNVVTTYTVKVLSTGTTTASTLIYDFSGSSYHYNSDFGSRGVITITALPPPLTLSKLATPSPVSPGGTVTYTLRIANTGPNAVSIADYVDTLPTSPAQPSYVAGSSTFNGTAISNPTVSGAMLTWAGSFSIPAGQARDLSFRVVMPSEAGTYVNNAIAHANEFQIDTTPTTTDNAPATANVVVVAQPNITLTKSVTPAGTQTPGTELAYTITFTNTGGSAASNFTLTDPNLNTTLKINDNTDFKVGSVVNNPGTTGLSVTVSYSSDGGANHTYTPASGGGGAPAGFDRNVTHVRWTFSGPLSATAPNNAGNVGFAVRIR